MAQYTVPPGTRCMNLHFLVQGPVSAKNLTVGVTTVRTADGQTAYVATARLTPVKGK